MLPWIHLKRDAPCQGWGSAVAGRVYCAGRALGGATEGIKASAGSMHYLAEDTTDHCLMYEPHPGTAHYLTPINPHCTLTSHLPTQPLHREAGVVLESAGV